jgi:hypothetical protein
LPVRRAFDRPDRGQVCYRTSATGNDELLAAFHARKQLGEMGFGFGNGAGGHDFEVVILMTIW